MDSQWNKLFEEYGSELLHRNENHNQLNFSCLDKMYRDELLCDVILESEGMEIYAHKVILATCSTFFYWKFSHGRQSECLKRIVINNISYKTLYACVNYFYTSEVHITHENIEDLFNAARSLAVSSLQEACWGFLQANLHPGNCIGIGRIAAKYECKKLESKVDDYIVEHFPDIIKHDEYLHLTYGQVLDLVSRDVLCVTEENVLDFVIGWVGYDYRQRKEHVEALMNNVRLSLISQKNILRRINNERWLKSDNQFLLQFVNTLEGNLRCVVKQRQPSQLLAAVGMTGSDLLSLDMYDFQKNIWLEHSGVLETKFNSNYKAAIYGRAIYIIGVYKMILVNLCDPTRIIWTKYSSMLEPRSEYNIKVLDNFIYVVGGFQNGEYVGTTERFNISTGTWKKLANMPEQRRCLGLGTLNGELYAVGGAHYPSRYYLTTVECYKPDSNSWNTLPQMSITRMWPGVGSLGDTLFVVGGIIRNTEACANVECFNLTQSTWKRLPDMKYGRTSPGVIAINGLLYVIGGCPSRTVEVYDPKCNTWSELPCLNTDIKFVTACLMQKM